MIFHEISVDFRGLRKFVEIGILVESRSEIDEMSRKSSLGQSKVSLIEKNLFRFFFYRNFFFKTFFLQRGCSAVAKTVK